MKLSPDELVKIRKIQLKVERMATDKLVGLYRSAFKGRGLEFEEVREFQPGDEIRSIDWNVTARMGSPFVKLYREERQLTLLFAVDISRSMQFGSINTLKRYLINEITAILAYSGIKNQDNIGLLLFDKEVQYYLAPQKGAGHILRLIRDLYATQSNAEGTSIANALHYIGKIQKKKAILFLLSDFLDPTPFEKEVALLSHHHELIAVCVQDPREKQFPNVGLITLKDLESSLEQLVDTANPALNQTLDEYISSSQAKAKRIIEKNKGSWIEVSTDRSYLIDLMRFFSKR